MWNEETCSGVSAALQLPAHSPGMPQAEVQLGLDGNRLRETSL